MDIGVNSNDKEISNLLNSKSEYSLPPKLQAIKEVSSEKIQQVSLFFSDTIKILKNEDVDSQRVVEVKQKWQLIAKIVTVIAVTAILMGVSFGGAAVGIGAAAALSGVSIYLSPMITSISISIGIFAIAQLKFIAKNDNMFKVTETPLEDIGKYLLKVSVATLLTSAIAAGGSAVSVVITPIVAVAASSPILGKITGTVSSIAINIFLSAGAFFIAERPNILENNSVYVISEY